VSSEYGREGEGGGAAGGTPPALLEPLGGAPSLRACCSSERADSPHARAAVQADGRMYCWGNNRHGELGSEELWEGGAAGLKCDKV